MIMKVISLQSKTRILLWILAAAFLVGLLMEALSVRMLDSEDILLITPISSNSSGINAEQLEEINGKHFLLSYEILTRENLRALNANFEVMLRKTNYVYHYMMGFKMLTGSFFTEEDQKRKQKAAVLNEAAAYAMFGSIDVCGRKVTLDQEEYIVAGVIDDRKDAYDEKSGEDQVYNVYIPASISNQDPYSFAVQLSNTITAAQVKNECKYLTVPQSGYQYIHFGNLADLVYGMLFIALKTALIGVLLVIYGKSHNEFKVYAGHIRSLHKHFYFKEILHRERNVMVKVVVAGATITLTVLLILGITFSFIEDYLIWEASASILKSSDSSVFGEIASALQRDIYRSAFLLTGFILDIVLLLSHSRRKIHILLCKKYR